MPCFTIAGSVYNTKVLSIVRYCLFVSLYGGLWDDAVDFIKLFARIFRGRHRFNRRLVKKVFCGSLDLGSEGLVGFLFLCASRCLGY